MKATAKATVKVSEASKAFNAEMKSFEACVTMLVNCQDATVKKFMNERGWTKKELTAKENKHLICKSVLFEYVKLATFFAADGTPYKAIFSKSKDKEGNEVIKEARWTGNRVLRAMDAKYKDEQAEAKKAKAIEEMKVADKSRQDLAAELKKKSGKKSAKKAA